MINALSFDIEDYFQVSAFESVVCRSEWDKYPSRVVDNTRKIIALLNKHQVQATFFVLGWVADHFPDLVQEISAAGHELATHGYWHRLVYQQTPGEFEEDLEKSLVAIRNADSNSDVIGYRAPTFSLSPDTSWALEILSRHGIKYSSSVFPVSIHDRYSNGTAPRFAHLTEAGILEIPLSTIRWANFNFAVAGGGYLRFYPQRLTCKAIRILNTQHRPAIVYLHPWEFDPEQPRVQGASLRSRIRHYLNLDKTASRLEHLLKQFEFGPIKKVFQVEG